MSDLFPEVDGQMVGVDAEGFTKISRVDLGSYERYLDQVQEKGPGFEARLVVETGDPVTTRDGKRTGRGKTESKHDRAFRAVAANRNIGIRIVPEHLPNDTTMLRIAITKKREFTDLTNARRDRGRLNYQAGKALEKANKAKMQNTPDAPELLKKAQEIQAQVKRLDSVIDDLTNGQAKAPAAKTAAPVKR
jgi:hypothetical protein